MIEGNLALKLEDFEEEYCYPHIVGSDDKNLPDNIIQFPKVDNGQGQALSLQYDDNGNLTRKDDSQGATAYSWDGENRLIGINYPDGTSDEYVYDGVGKRIQVSEDGVITNYLYDGLNVIIEQNNSGMTTASYVRDLGYSGGIGSIISKQGAGGSKQYYYYDGIGNVVNTADNAGNVTQSFVYDAYGNILNEAVPSPHGFSTKEYSNRSGLIHFGARVYDPMTGRFISKDPIGFSDGMNVYNYCGSDPINWIDPIGLCAKNVVSNSGDTIKTLVLPMMLNFTTIKKFAFKFGKSIAWPKLVSSGTTGSNKFYWPGRKIGGKASKSFRLPIAKSAGNMLGAYAVATDLKVLGENWQAGSRGLQTLHDFAMLGADTAGFFGNSPPTAFLKLIPALARATDYSSNYWGGKYMETKEKIYRIRFKFTELQFGMIGMACIPILATVLCIMDIGNPYRNLWPALLFVYPMAAIFLFIGWSGLKYIFILKDDSITMKGPGITVEAKWDEIKKIKREWLIYSGYCYRVKLKTKKRDIVIPGTVVNVNELIREIKSRTKQEKIKTVL